MKSNTRDLVGNWGKDKINTLTKFPSILTYHQLGERGMLLEATTTDLTDEYLFIQEKVDGTNCRIIICQDGSYLIGARDAILYSSGDLYFDPTMDIVESLHKLVSFEQINHSAYLTVIYGELYGSKIGSNGKNYSTSQVGFRVFDVCQYPKDIVNELLRLEIQKLSQWREHSKGDSLAYGQPFMDVGQVVRFCVQSGLDYLSPYVERTDFPVNGSVATVSDWLSKTVKHTAYILDGTGLNKPEGVVIRNRDRSKIVKVRFEDYQRTLRKRT